MGCYNRGEDGMRRNAGTVVLEIRRMLFSPSLWLGILGAFLWMFFLTLNGLVQRENTLVSSVITSVDLAVDLNSSYIVLLGIVPIFPYALSLIQEWNEHATPFWMIRTGVTAYTVAKLVAVALSGFLTVFLGMILYIVVQHIFLPWGDMTNTFSRYNEASDSIFIYFLLVASHKGASAMLVAVCALWITTYFSSAYAAIIAPNALYWIVMRIFSYIPLPEILNPLYLLQAYGHGMYTWDVQYSMHWIIILVLCILMGMNTVGRMRKKVEHD